MRKLKEVLRLRYELGLGQRQIARSCSIGQGTVYEYLKRAQAAGVTWPLPEGWDDRRLEEALLGPAPRRVYENRKPIPDFAQLHEELQRHPHLTLQLAWEEYRQAHPDGYGYSRFCELYQQCGSNWMWCCAKTTRPARSSSLITRGRRFPSMTRRVGRSAQPRSLSPSWGPATTPTPKPPRARSWRTGSAPTSAPSNFWVASPSCG